MYQAELIDALERSRDAMADTLDRLTDEQYEIAGVSGERSVKDLLAHLTMWEAQLITLLFRAKQGAVPNTAHFSKDPRPEINRRWLNGQKNRALEKVVEEFEGIRDQTIRRVGEFSDAELADPKRFSWLNGRPLWQWILADTVEHEGEHRGEIERWLDG